MSVKYGFKVPINATGHLPPPNKEEQVVIAIDKLAYPSPIFNKHQYKGVFVLRPIIDRLEIGSSVPKDDYEALLKAYKSYGYPATDEWKLLGHEAKKSLSKKLGFVQHAFEWSPDGKWNGSVLVTMRSNQNQGYVKIIFAASLLSAKDMLAFRDFWNLFLQHHDHLGLKLHQLYSKKNAIRRLDIAVDVLNAHVGAFFPRLSSSVSSSSIKKKTKMAVYQNPSGRKQTIYLPYSPKSTMNDYLYDKKQELSEKGQASDAQLAIDAFKDVPCPASLREAAIAVIPRTQWPLCIFTILGWAVFEKEREQSSTLQDDLEVVPEFEGIPIYAVDGQFTRLGQSCLQRLRKEVQQLQLFTPAQIAQAAFWVEGGRLNLSYMSPMLKMFRNRSILSVMTNLGLNEARYTELDNILRSNWSRYNQIRLEKLEFSICGPQYNLFHGA